MRLRLLAAALLLSAAFGVSAQHPNNSHLIEFTPVTCIRAGELPLLQMNVGVEGELRAYFRRLNTTDWCSVMGTNDGPLSRVVLPKFDDGDEIEYFFVVIQGRRVVSRSQRIYRAKVDKECQATFARHIIRISMSCGEEQQAIPTAMGAGMAITDTLVLGAPEVGSKDDPNQQSTGRQ